VSQSQLVVRIFQKESNGLTRLQTKGQARKGVRGEELSLRICDFVGTFPSKLRSHAGQPYKVKRKLVSETPIWNPGKLAKGVEILLKSFLSLSPSAFTLFTRRRMRSGGWTEPIKTRGRHFVFGKCEPGKRIL